MCSVAAVCAMRSHRHCYDPRQSTDAAIQVSKHVNTSTESGRETKTVRLRGVERSIDAREGIALAQRPKQWEKERGRERKREREIERGKGRKKEREIVCIH